MDRSAKGICMDRSVMDHLFTTQNWQQHFEACIKEGMDVDSKSHDGWTLLHYAIEAENFEAAGWLIKNGANIDARDDFGWSALHCAVRSDIEMTIAANAPINLHSALFLIEHGANPAVKNNLGLTPEDIAAEFGEEAHQHYRSLLAGNVRKLS